MFVREPVVAGTFYPKGWDDITNYLSSIIKPIKPKIKPKAIMVPHAGYIYSGYVAARAYELISSFDTYVIIGPNHTGLGEEISIFDGIYDMPFGRVESDRAVEEYILDRSPAKKDYYAHIQEHSIEVQLPFIEYISTSPYKIVPIIIGTHDRKKLKELGIALADAVRSFRKDVLIVVSSDMNHYEDQNTTLKKDNMAIDRMKELDEEGLFDVVERYNISMCGVAGCYVAIVATKLLKAKGAYLIDHRTSGDINKDYNQVVGYASVIIE